jgi:hypothetical protein
VVNLEEPALFNQTLDAFLTQVEAGRWPPRDPRSIRNEAPGRTWLIASGGRPC